jgi:hypothetical protein
MSQPPKDLFKRFDTPPSPIHDAAQKWARHEGWTAPWDRKQQKSEAGKKSGLVRRSRAEVRLYIVRQVYEQLDPKYKHQPYSNDSMDALREKYFSVLGERCDNPQLDPQPSVRTSPTEDELKSFALDVESISQLPESDRMDALRRDFDYFLDNTTPPFTLTGDDAVQHLLQEKNLSEGTIDGSSYILPPNDEFDSLSADFHLWTSVTSAMAELSESDRQALQRVSRETLRKCLRQLGVKGGRRTRRSG